MSLAVGAIASRALGVARELILNQPPTLGDSDCEALHAGFFSQPVNTTTSLSFAAVGVWAASRVPSLRSEHRAAASVFAALVALNGVGSVAYHGPQFAGSQTLHDLPAYGVVGMSVAVPLWRILNGRTALPGWSTGRGLMMTTANTVAVASYLQGRTASRLCDPDSWLQLHGLWHLSTAAAMAIWAMVLWPTETADSPADPDRGDAGREDPVAMGVGRGSGPGSGPENG